MARHSHSFTIIILVSLLLLGSSCSIPSELNNILGSLPSDSEDLPVSSASQENDINPPTSNNIQSEQPENPSGSADSPSPGVKQNQPENLNPITPFPSNTVLPPQTGRFGKAGAGPDMSGYKLVERLNGDDGSLGRFNKVAPLNILGDKAFGFLPDPLPSKSGDKAIKFTVRSSDNVGEYRYRAQLSLLRSNGGQNFVIGKEYILKYQIYVAPDWQPEKFEVGIVDFHNSGTVMGLKSSPQIPSIFAMNMSPNGSLVVHYLLDIGKEMQTKGAAKNTETAGSKDIGPLNKGKWNSFILHYKASTGNDGIFEFFREGAKVVEQLNTPNAYPDHAPYFKFGMHKWIMKGSNGKPVDEMWFDDVEIWVKG